MLFQAKNFACGQLYATSPPKDRAMSSSVTPVSSTVSWSRAAAMVTSSSPRSDTMRATASGCWT